MTEDARDQTDERLHDPEGPDTPNMKPPPDDDRDDDDDEEEAKD